MQAKKRKVTRRPSTPVKRNPFGDDPEPKRKKTAEDSDDGQRLFALPHCPICLEDLRLPTVDTECCHQQMCELCATEVVAHESDKSQGPSCPVCTNQPFRYELSIVFNRLLGSREVPCTNVHEGCKQRVPISDMQLHLGKFCDFTAIRCAQQAVGCPWTGFRTGKADHERTCVHVDYARIREVWSAEERKVDERLRAMAVQCEAMEKRIDGAAGRFEGHIRGRIRELEHVQQNHVNNLTSKHLLAPKSGTHPLQVRRQDSKYTSTTTVVLWLNVAAGEDEFRLSIASKDVKLKYPFWLAGYAVCLNKRMPALTATQQFHFRFGSSQDCLEIICIPRSALDLGAGDDGRRKVEPITVQLLASVYSE